MNVGNVMEPEILVWNEEDMVPEELTYLTGRVVGLQVVPHGEALPDSHYNPSAFLL